MAAALARAHAPAADPVEGSALLDEAALKPWSGDWSGMLERRRLRVLVVYSRTFYFVDRGVQRGLTYEAFRFLEEDLNRTIKSRALKFHVVFIPVARDELLPALRAGRGDVAAANLTVTSAREAEVDFTTPVLKEVTELVVTGPRSPQLKTLEDLSGQSLYVRRSSSYWQHLAALNQRLVAAGRSPVTLVAADEDLEDEDLLEMLNAGLLGAVVVDDHKARFWRQIFPRLTVRSDLVLSEDGAVAWAIRPDSPQLKAVLDGYIDKHGVGAALGNTLLKRYLSDVRHVKAATSSVALRRFDETVQLFRQYGDRYDLDYLLMMAQGYQESRLDQHAHSQVGAVGIMQVMPATGRELKVGDIRKLEPNIHAGVKYIRHMIDNYYAEEPMSATDRMLFAFASYNCGPRRIQTLRREAARRGLDPNRWFRNVELVAADKVGAEPVTYVANIYKYYVAYNLVTAAKTRKEEALRAMPAQAEE